MRVYRVERASDGRGPYMGLGREHRELHDAHGYGSARHPNAYEDRCVETQRELAQVARDAGITHIARRHGFASLGELREWFDGDWPQYLHDRGYRISVYHADVAVRGERQTLFDVYRARRVTAFALRPTAVAKSPQSTKEEDA